MLCQTTIEEKTWVRAGRSWVLVTSELRRDFEALVDRSGGPDACHAWQGSINQDGYGTLGVIRQCGWVSFGAHRLAYLLEHGEIPLDLLVCHRCDNPHCVNGRHLFLGTPQDNIDDMLAKGRGPRGEYQSGRLRLDDSDALAILDLYYNTGEHTYNSLARMFDVDRRIIKRIVNRKLWPELPFEIPLGMIRRT